MRKLALPLGVILFVLGIFYAGVPFSAHRAIGTSFGLLPETLTVIGFVMFVAGALLMLSGRHNWGKHKSLWDLSKDMDGIKHAMKRHTFLKEVDEHLEEYKKPESLAEEFEKGPIKVSNVKEESEGADNQALDLAED